MSKPIRFSSLALHPISGLFELRRHLILPSPVAMAMALLLAAALVLLPAGDGARADALSDARAAGTVGERYDGYLALRNPSAPAGARQLVEDINAKRRQLYNQVSTREGTTIDSVGRIYAREIVGNVPPGTWILQENGQWVQK
jgi:uncharacterized protein YdbL (DUF1318 family)